jgi:hypothetical protein
MDAGLHNAAMNLRLSRLLSLIVLFSFVFATKSFGACSGIESESHFRLLAESSSVRVFELELERLQSTASYCQEHPFFYVVTTDGETTNFMEGHAGVSRKWNVGSSRFVSGPETHIIRNDAGTTHREIIVEILTPLESNAFRRNYDEDDFPPMSPQVAVTNDAVSVQHGPVSAIKAQLIGGGKLSVPASTKVLIALTDGKLTGNGKDFDLRKGQIEGISADSDFEFINSGRLPIRFVTIAF